MSDYTTDYVSAFPSGFMDENIQAERRDDTPATVAGARDYNRHDVEILRIQEVLGLEPAAQSGVPNPTGAIYTVLYQNYQHIQNIINGSGVAFSGAANQIPFHNDPSDPNYQFMQWFLEWMGIWPWLSVGGTETPSITEVVKALWQNKYELEVIFDPKFLWPAEGDGINNYVTKLMTTDVPVNAGFSVMVPKKPIGAFCDLDYRPFPIYEIYDVTAGGYLQGQTVLPSGNQIRFYTDVTLVPHSGANYEVSLFGNSPYETIVGGGPILEDTDPLAKPTLPPITGPTQPTMPPPHDGIIPGFPGPIDTGLPPWADPIPGNWEPVPEGPVDTPIEVGTIIVAPPLKAIHDQQGNIQISSIEMQAITPVPWSGFGGAPGSWAQLLPELAWGVALQADAAKFSLIGQPKTWINFYATIGVSALEPPGPYVFNNPAFYVYKYEYSGLALPHPIPIVFPIDAVLWPCDAGQYITVLLGQIYCEEKTLIEAHLLDDPPVAAPPFIVTGFSAECVGYKG
jgi:hypothetical protein